MKKRTTAMLMILSAAAFSAAMAGCEADDSLPTRPRTAANPLAPDSNAQNNAEKRELEKPGRNLPTAGAEFPGQSRADFDTDARVLTLQASGGGAGGGGGAAGGAGASGGAGAAGGAGGVTGVGGAGAAGGSGGIGGTTGGTLGGGTVGGSGVTGGTVGTPGGTISPGAAGTPGSNNPAAAPSNSGFIGSNGSSAMSTPTVTGAPTAGAVPNSSGLTSGPSEGQSPLSFLGFNGPSGLHAFGHTFGPQTVYGLGNFPYSFPLIPANPGTVPTPGVTLTPSGEWAMDNSWGQGLVLQDYPHRPWPVTTIYYQSGAIYNNPTYYFHIGDYVQEYPATSGVYEGSVESDFYEVPWFMVNTAALPLLMALEPPLAKRITARPIGDPNFRGYVQPDGPLVPAPQPGTLQWNYSFLNPDWTVKEPTSAATEPNETTESAPATQPATGPATMPAG